MKSHRARVFFSLRRQKREKGNDWRREGRPSRHTSRWGEIIESTAVEGLQRVEASEEKDASYRSAIIIIQSRLIHTCVVKHTFYLQYLYSISNIPISTISPVWVELLEHIDMNHPDLDSAWSNLGKLNPIHCKFSAWRSGFSLAPANSHPRPGFLDPGFIDAVGETRCWWLLL